MHENRQEQTNLYPFLLMDVLEPITIESTNNRGILHEKENNESWVLTRCVIDHDDPLNIIQSLGYFRSHSLSK